MGLKLGQNINIWLFFRFLSVSGRDKRFWSRQSFLVETLVATYCLSRHWSRHTACRDTGRDKQYVATSVATSSMSRPVYRGDTGRYSLLGRDTGHDTGHDILPVATYFLTVTCFSSPTCRGHNFFILTRIWACEYSLERSLNVECSHEGI